MKTKQVLFIPTVLIVCSMAALAWTPPGSGWQVSERGPDHRKWTRVGPGTNGAGGVVLRTNTVVELAGGMHVKKGGEWIDARPEIVPAAGGALCRGARHEVWLASNLKTWAAVRVHTSQDKWFKGNVLGVGYYDTNSGQTVMLAQVKDCQGVIAGTNQVIYEDAFEGIKADVRYTYTKAGFEQDVILRQCPMLPQAAGLKSDNVALFVMTELVDIPAPERIISKSAAVPRLASAFGGGTAGATNTVSWGTNAPGTAAAGSSSGAKGKTGLSAAQSRPQREEQVELLSFGGMILSRGKAFEMGTNESTGTVSLTNRATGAVRRVESANSGKSAPVKANWFQSEGRSFLIEQVPMKEVRQQLQKLPLTARVQGQSKGTLHKVLPGFVAPEVRLALQSKDSMLLAKAVENKPGLVMDYYLSGSLTDWTFDYYATYVVSGDCHLDGVTTICDGAVIKNNGGTGLELNGPVVCPQWDPAYITSVEDDSVGEPTSQGRGLWAGSYGNGLRINYDGPCQLRNLQIAYADAGLYLCSGRQEWASEPWTIDNCSFNECCHPFYLDAVKVESSGCHLYGGDYYVDVFSGSRYLFTGSGLSFDLWSWNWFARDAQWHNSGENPQSAVRLSGSSISARDGASSPVSTSASVAVLIAPPTVTLTATDKSAVKGSSDTGSFTFSRTGDTSQELQVTFSTLGSAVAGLDYYALPGTVTIPAGASSTTLTLTPLAPNPAGLQRSTVQLKLGEALAYIAGSPSAATVTITDPTVTPPTGNSLLNIDFNGGPTSEVGLAATGLTPSDFWNSCSAGFLKQSGSMSDLAWSDGSNAGVGLTIDNAPGGWGLNSGDPMYNVFRYPWDGGSITVTLTGLPAGYYDFYIYGHGDTTWGNGAYQVSTSGFATVWKNTEASAFAASSSDWNEDVQYVLFRYFQVASGQPVTITAAPSGAGGGGVINGMQIMAAHPEPTIVAQPASQAVAQGASTSFAVYARGMEPLSYQWRFNGGDITGATGNTYSRPNVQPADVGNYSVVVSNAAGSVTSAPALLSIVVPPFIVAGPLNQAVVQGDTASFSVSASGTAPLSYQWRGNGVSIAGATSSVYSLANAQLTDAGTYSVTVTNLVGVAQSTDAVLTVVPTDWLVQYFGPDYQSNPQASLSADPDQDGLTNLQEYQQGTNPTRPDSNGNGVIDQVFKVMIVEPKGASALP